MMITKTTTQKAGKFVDTEHVDMVRAEYKKERWLQNSERLGKPDSLSVWFDSEILEEFMDVCREHGADGVRCYFAVYPKDFTEKEGFAGRQSLVLVGTKSKVDEEGNITNKDIYIYKNGQNTILGLNMPNPCPPYCKQFGDPDLGVIVVDKGNNEGLQII